MVRLNMSCDVYKANITKFLKENNCLEKFAKNLFNNGKSLESLYTKIYSFEDIIDKAFRWSETPEGYNYWCNLHKKLQFYKCDLNILKDFWYD